VRGMGRGPTRSRLAGSSREAGEAARGGSDAEEPSEARHTAAEMILLAKYALLRERQGGAGVGGGGSPAGERGAEELAVDRGVEAGPKRRRTGERSGAPSTVPRPVGGQVIRAYGGGQSVAESAQLSKVRDAADRKRKEALLAEAAMLAGSQASALPVEPLVQNAPPPPPVRPGGARGGRGYDEEEGAEGGGGEDDDDDGDVRPQMYDSDLEGAPGAQLEEEDEYGRQTMGISYGHDDI